MSDHKHQPPLDETEDDRLDNQSDQPSDDPAPPPDEDEHRPHPVRATDHYWKTWLDFFHRLRSTPSVSEDSDWLKATDRPGWLERADRLLGSKTTGIFRFADRVFRLSMQIAIVYLVGQLLFGWGEPSAALGILTTLLEILRSSMEASSVTLPILAGIAVVPRTTRYILGMFAAKNGD